MHKEMIEQNKDELKKKVIFDFAVSVIVVLMTVAILFFPIFHSAELGRSFSFFDELMNYIQIMNGEGLVEALIAGMVPLMAGLYTVLLFVVALIEVIKKASAFTNLDKTIMKTYDEIISPPQEEQSEQKKKFTVNNLMWSAVAFIVAVVISGKFSGLGFYMASVTGADVLFTILFGLIVVGYIVLALLSRSITNKVKDGYMDNIYNE